MMADQFSWIPGLVAGFVGLLGGVVASLWLHGRKEGTDFEMLREDLDERKAHLVTQLRELEQQQERMDPKAYAEQKAEFEAKAADVLRERDALEARAQSEGEPALEKADVKEVPADVSPVVGFMHRHPALRGALWTVIVIGTGAMLFYFVTSEQSVRPAGGSMTGNSAPMGGGMGGGMPGGMPEQPSSAIGMIPPMLQGALAGGTSGAELMQRMQQNPNDVATLVAVGHELLRAQRYDVAKAVNQRVLVVDPQNVEAKVHAAVIRAAEGDVEGGLADLNALLQKHPTELEGWIYRGLLALERGDRKLAAESFAAYVAHAPEGPPKAQVQSLLMSLGQADG